MFKVKKVFSCVLIMFFTLVTILNYAPAQAAGKATVVPQVQFANAPVTEYKVGDRVGFNIFSPNYGGRVEYRVVLWNDSKKSYSDLWHEYNGYPTRYYTKWQPYGNNIFTLGWIINEPGSYRITVYAKRVGIPNSKGALKGKNCDSYMESVAFRVKSKEATVQSILPLADITVNQYTTPTLPATVKALMSDSTEKSLKVTWETADTTKPGTFTLAGTVEGTSLKAYQKLIVNQVSTVLSVNKAEATAINTVKVSLNQSIYFTPDLSRFSLRAYGYSNVRLYSLTVAADKKAILISTDNLILGNWYTLKVDSYEYVFQVPYNFTSQNQVNLVARNVEVNVNGSVYPDITVYPTDAVLSFVSADPNIATFDTYTKKIVGVSPGTATFYVTASKTGLANATATFYAVVKGSSVGLVASPTVLKESSANNGMLEDGSIYVEAKYDYFKQSINKNNVHIDNLPDGMDFTVHYLDMETILININGTAEQHTVDQYIRIYVYGGTLSEYSDVLMSNEVKIDFNSSTALVAPEITISPDGPTSGKVTVTVIYPANAAVKKYKIGTNGTEQDYTGPFEVESNTTVYARYKLTPSGLWSTQASKKIENIDKEAPDTPEITINPEGPTNLPVAVTINYPADAAVKQYKSTGGNWQTYTAAFAVTENTTVYARCMDAAGNTSGEAEYVIDKIDHDSPKDPVFKETPDGNKIKVEIDFGDATIQKYRIDNGNWMEYGDPIVMDKSGTIEAYGIDAAGNKSNTISHTVTITPKEV